MKRILHFTLALAVFGLVSLSAADARENWDKHCTKCHGKEGKGDTTMGKKLKVLDYSNPEHHKKFTDDEAFKVTKEGKKEGNKTLMKGFGGELTDDEIRALVKLVREMKK